MAYDVCKQKKSDNKADRTTTKSTTLNCFVLYLIHEPYKSNEQQQQENQ